MITTVSRESTYATLGLPDSPVIVDVRTETDYLALPRLIPGAMRGSPDQLGSWSRNLPGTRAVTVYCADGGAASSTAAESLVSMGYPVSILDGGLAGWTHAGHVTVRGRPEYKSPGASQWVTRERPKIDRLACPWLVRRFIDPDAQFFYTQPHRVRSQATALDAQPYDIADVTFSHNGPKCSFDAFLNEFDLHDPVLDRIADIVRAADTGELAQSPQAPGLLAISLGLSANVADDTLLLEQAMPVYDGLYAWCKVASHETHSWPMKPAAGAEPRGLVTP